MSSGIASLLCLLVIATCFYLDRDKADLSLGLWVPIAWLSICASRTVGQWIGGTIGASASASSIAEGSSVDGSVFALFVFAGLVVAFFRRKRILTLLRGNGPLLFFLLYCVLSVAWSDFPAVAFKRWIKELGDVTMVSIVLTERQPSAALRRFLTWPGFVLVPLSILLIRYFPSLGREYSDWTGEAYNIGVATGKNGLGYVCLIFGLGAVWSILSVLRLDRKDRSRRRQLIANGILLLLTFWLFHMAHSATSFACFFIGSFLMFVTRKRWMRKNRSLVYATIGIVLFLVIYGLFLNPEIGLTNVVGRDATLTGRTRIWSDVLKLTVNPVIGAGYESFWLGDRLEKMWVMNGEHLNQAHNGYLEVYLDLGWIGLLIIGTVMFWGFRNAVRALATAPQLGSLKLAFFVVAAMYNCTEHAFRELHPVWIIFLLAVFAIPPRLRQEFA